MTVDRPLGARHWAKMKMPVLMGAGMGLMMLWMVHGVLIGETTVGVWAAVVFVLAHVAVVLIVVLGAVFAARLSPKLRGFVVRVHRPSLGHLGAMMASAAVAAGVAHLFVHGGI